MPLAKGTGHISEARRLAQPGDASGGQVLTLLVLVVAAAVGGWVVGGWGGSTDGGRRPDVFAIFIVVVAFLAIAAASWTSMAQLSRAQAARRRADLLLGAVGEGICGLDLDGRVVFINPAGATLCGYEVSEVVGLVHHDVVHHHRADGSPYPVEECPVSRTLVDGIPRQRANEVFWRKDGTAFPVAYRATPVGDADRVTGVVVSFRDVTERERYEDELRQQAKSDRLTGLSNRSGFQERLETSAIPPSGAQAVLLVDLDDFKAVNDTFGHGAGDQLLKAVGDRLRSVVGPGDTIARLGGDEFGVLLEGVSEEEARAVARRFLETLDEPVVVDGREIFVRASAGVALRHPAQEPGEVLRNSDAAMYAAKAGNRPVRLEVFDEGRDTHLLDDRALSSELAGAAERGELRLHYQPVVDMRTRRDISGFEALVRWEHPQRGLVSPARFVPLAEQTGLILPVGRWVLQEACRQARAWQDGLASPPYVSVNVSVRQLVDPEFVDLVRATLTDAGLRPGGLVVEVTETAVATELDAISAPLQELRHMGTRVFMDDFGTGYSSLSYLRRLPVDVVKIDRSFVQEITTSSEEWSLAIAIVRLMKALRLATVVEGVEDAAQLAHLRALGCDFAQGFYFSRPKPAEEFDSLAEPGAERMLIQSRDGGEGTPTM